MQQMEQQWGPGITGALYSRFASTLLYSSTHSGVLLAGAVEGTSWWSLLIGGVREEK